jgi:hypothetical protein
VVRRGEMEAGEKGQKEETGCRARKLGGKAQKRSRENSLEGTIIENISAGER